MANKTVDPTGKPSLVIGFKISIDDKSYLDGRHKLTGQSTSEYLRQLIRIDNQGGIRKRRLDEIKNELRELELKTKILEAEKEEIINDINANKTAAENIETAMDREIESLIPTLKNHSGRLVEIKKFVQTRVDTINNSYQTKDIKPLTIEKFTEKLREVAESQGVTCK